MTKANAKNRRELHIGIRLSLKIKIMIKHVQTKLRFEDIQIDKYLNLSIDIKQNRPREAWRK